MVIPMAGDQTPSIIVIATGLGLLVVSVLAEVIGVGDASGFRYQQKLGILAGAVIMLIGLYFMRKGGSTSGE